jgi:chromosome partitioning protein
MAKALSKEWSNEAYVSLHLVQSLLKSAGLNEQGGSHWFPQFSIKFPVSLTGVRFKKVDFLIEDYARQVKFLIEVKTSKTRIDDASRNQISDYMRYSGVRFGFLIDPYTIEVYEFHDWTIRLLTSFSIADPHDVKPASKFLREFLDKVKMRTIAIHTSKGGVGKTTLVVNIAYELAKRQHRVLVIDLDDQANASLSLGVNKADEFDKAQSLEEFEKILESFKHRLEIIEFIAQYDTKEFQPSQYIHPTHLTTLLKKSGCPGKVDVIPGSYKTKDGAISTLGAMPQKRLDKALLKAQIANDYDYVLIDTPPSSTTIAMNGLFASQYVIIPTQLEYLSMHGIHTPIGRLKEIREENSKRGIILGIVPMMVEKVTLSNTIKSLITKNFIGITLLPEISKSTCIGKASHDRKPISLYAQNSKDNQAGKLAKEFALLTDEIIKRIDTLESSIGV